MPRKNHEKNLWNGTLAQKIITNALINLEEKHPEKKDRFFSNSEIRNIVLKKGRDLNNNELKWWIIKPTFYRTLDRMVANGILTQNKEERKDKYSPYVFYRLNKFKNKSHEIKDDLKSGEFESIKTSLSNTPIYSYKTDFLTNIALSPIDGELILKDIRKLKRKIKRMWVKEEIVRFIASIHDKVKEPGYDGRITKFHLIGYCLVHLDWWLRMVGESPKSYKKFIDGLLRFEEKDEKMAKQYQKDIESLYENKQKWIDEADKRLWTSPTSFSQNNDGNQGNRNHTRFETVLNEIKVEGHLAEEDVILLLIQNELSYVFSSSNIYSLPRINPLLIMNIS